MNHTQRWTDANENTQEKYRSWAMLGAFMFCAAMMFFASVVGYFVFFEKPWLTYENLPFPIKIQPVFPGELIPIEVLRCNKSGKTQHYSIARSLENIKTGEFTTLPPIEVNMKAGCDAEPQMSTAHYAPLLMKDGEYRLFGTSQIQGLIVTHMVEWTSINFKIVKKPAPVPVVKIEHSVVTITRNIIIKPVVVAPAKPHTRSLYEP
jgi:hypothetical protein